MILDDRWWEGFWESEEGKILKALGGVGEADGEDVFALLKAYNRKPKVEVPEVFIKAYEGNDDVV